MTFAARDFRSATFSVAVACLLLILAACTSVEPTTDLAVGTPVVDHTDSTVLVDGLHSGTGSSGKKPVPPPVPETGSSTSLEAEDSTSEMSDGPTGTIELIVSPVSGSESEADAMEFPERVSTTIDLETSALPLTQVFEVRLDLIDPGDNRFRFNSCLDAGVNPYAMAEQIDTATFQFRFQPKGYPAYGNSTLTIARTGFAVPTRVRRGPEEDSVIVQIVDNKFTFGQLLLDSLDRNDFEIHFASGSGEFKDFDESGLPRKLELWDIAGDAVYFGGDTVWSCGYLAEGNGVLDTTPPTVFFGSYCRHFRLGFEPCKLLADSFLSVWFSEPVRIEGIGKNDLLRMDSPIDLWKSVRGVNIGGEWPLGGEVFLDIAPGLSDLAGNRAVQGASQKFQVVADPGILTNFSFETGDFSGFILEEWGDYYHPDAQGFPSPTDSPGRGASDTGTAEVTGEFAGLNPTDGDYMAAITSCQDRAEYSLTSRFTIPDEAETLTLDYNFLATTLTPFRRGSSSANSLVTGRLISGELIKEFVIPRPAYDEVTGESGGYSSIGFRNFSVPLDDLAGQHVILTLRVAPWGIPWPGRVSGNAYYSVCEPGVVLLDNLQFKKIRQVEVPPASVSDESSPAETETAVTDEVSGAARAEAANAARLAANRLALQAASDDPTDPKVYEQQLRLHFNVARCGLDSNPVKDRRLFIGVSFTAADTPFEFYENSLSLQTGFHNPWAIQLSNVEPNAAVHDLDINVLNPFPYDEVPDYFLEREIIEGIQDIVRELVFKCKGN